MNAVKQPGCRNQTLFESCLHLTNIVCILDELGNAFSLYIEYFIAVVVDIDSGTSSVHFKYPMHVFCLIL